MNILNRLKGKAEYQVTFTYTEPVMGFIRSKVTSSEPVLSRKSDISNLVLTHLEDTYGMPITDLEILHIKEPS